MKRGNRHHNSARLDGVAPTHMLREDFAALDAKTLLRCSYDVEQLLLMQSVEGHAHAGHGLFYGRKYANTTIDDVARSLRMDPALVKAERQELIDEIMDFAERVIEGENVTTVTNAYGEPLLRCGALRQLDIEPRGVLQGLYIGGLRDDADIRNLANQRYGVEMGYGECKLVDQRVLRNLGMDGFDLSQQGHEHEIDMFERAGLFGEDGDPNVAYMYVRLKEGPGASDDAAIVMAGKMLGFSAAVGCFLADAVDTLEKYVPKYSDQDSDISGYIQDNYQDLGVTRDHGVDLAYLCAIPRELRGKLPDCSLRHFLQIDRKHDQCALESHLAYLAGKPFAPMELDHGECSNLDFYAYIEERFAGFRPVR